MVMRSRRLNVSESALPDRVFERRLAGDGLVCGVDEAGRGPWAGPVAVAAVILGEGRDLFGLNDSKKLTASERERLYGKICASCHVAVVFASVARIDAMNIRAATLWAMGQAVAALPVRPGFALIDGRDVPADLPVPAKAIIQGDGKSVSIAAASVIAKVSRDRLMREMAGVYPGYGFERHMGYGVPEHAAALQQLGVTPLHRRSFKPVAAVIRA